MFRICVLFFTFVIIAQANPDTEMRAQDLYTRSRNSVWVPEVKVLFGVSSKQLLPLPVVPLAEDEWNVYGGDACGFISSLRRFDTFIGVVLSFPTQGNYASAKILRAKKTNDILWRIESVKNTICDEVMALASVATGKPTFLFQDALQVFETMKKNAIRQGICHAET